MKIRNAAVTGFLSIALFAAPAFAQSIAAAPNPGPGRLTTPAEKHYGPLSPPAMGPAAPGGRNWTAERRDFYSPLGPNQIRGKERARALQSRVAREIRIAQARGVRVPRAERQQLKGDADLRKGQDNSATRHFLLAEEYVRRTGYVGNPDGEPSAATSSGKIPPRAR